MNKSGSDDRGEKAGQLEIDLFGGEIFCHHHIHLKIHAEADKYSQKMTQNKSD